MRHAIKVGIVLLFFLFVSSVVALRTFTVEETNFVKISSKAVDVDRDVITYNYSAPLNSKGEWQTDYDDAGEYLVNITASDQKNTSVETVKIVVKNKNQAPLVKKQRVSVEERQTVDLKEYVADPDNDVLVFSFEKPFSDGGIWQPGYDDQGTYIAQFTVNDGEFTTKGRIEIEVINKNQPPIVQGSFARQSTVTVKENASLDFWIEGRDGDNDPLTYIWYFNGSITTAEKKGSLFFDYTSAGTYVLAVNVSDGTHRINKEWNLVVQNNNRLPRIDKTELAVEEGENVTLVLPVRDDDGDVIHYTLPKPFDEQGKWVTTYDDAGIHRIKVTAADGQATIKQEIVITVLDVDRAPILTAPDLVSVNEGETLLFNISSQDPDGDRVNITMLSLPAGAQFDSRKNTVTWRPSLDEIKRRGGVISTMLNTLRLERFLIQEKELRFSVRSCGKQKCTEHNGTIVVHNVNRIPELQVVSPPPVREGELIALEPVAVDPDEDIIHYYYTEPVDKRSGRWQTSDNDEGNHTVYITATDGQASQTKPVRVTVLRNNHPPSIRVADDDITVNEGQQFLLRVEAQDGDGDAVQLTLNSSLTGTSFKEGQFTWQPPYTTVANKSEGIIQDTISSFSYLNKKLNADERILWLSFTAFDGEATTIHPVKITVKNVNQAPVLLNVSPQHNLVVKAGEPVLFTVTARDYDHDELHYRWNFGAGQEVVVGTSRVERTFVTPGQKVVALSISDGTDDAEYTWVVDVVPAPVVHTQIPVALEPLTFRVYEVEG